MRQVINEAPRDQRSVLKVYGKPATISLADNQYAFFLPRGSVCSRRDIIRGATKRRSC